MIWPSDSRAEPRVVHFLLTTVAFPRLNLYQLITPGRKLENRCTHWHTIVLYTMAHLPFPLGLQQSQWSAEAEAQGKGMSPDRMVVHLGMWAPCILQGPPTSWGLWFRRNNSHSFFVFTMCQVLRQRNTTSFLFCSCAIILWIYNVDTIPFDFSFRDVSTPQQSGDNWS